MFKAGDRVKCVDDSGMEYLEAGRVYKVTSLQNAPEGTESARLGRQYVTLEEVEGRYRTIRFTVAV